VGDAEALRRLRADAVLRGFCGTCRLRRPRVGIKTCDVCLGQGKKRKQTSRAEGHCGCGRSLRDRRFRQCERCRRRGRRRGRARLRRLLAKERCLRHPDVLALPGHVYCGQCLDERAAAARARTRARSGPAMRELGCSVCGRTDHNVLRHDRAQAPLRAGDPSGGSD